jgi:hypothetical protein
VDCRHKEDYLSDAGSSRGAIKFAPYLHSSVLAEFQKLFRMTREEFRNLATWRQQLRKRDLRLF